MSQEELEEEKVSSAPVDDEVEIIDPDDETLNETQRIRLKLIGNLDKDEEIHKDPKLSNILIKLLDGADKQVLGKRRIKAQENGNKATSDMANAIERALREHGSKMTRNDVDKEPPTDYRPPAPNLKKFDIDPGEVSPVGEPVDVEKIIRDTYASKPVDDED